MDIRCRKCGEPWDYDVLHEEAEYRVAEGTAGEYGAVFSAVRRDFTKSGCAALSAYGPALCSGGTAHPGIGVIYELLGDDIDGAASLLEDAEYLGMLS